MKPIRLKQPKGLFYCTLYPMHPHGLVSSIFNLMQEDTYLIAAFGGILNGPHSKNLHHLNTLNQNVSPLLISINVLEYLTVIVTILG